MSVDGNRAIDQSHISKSLCIMADFKLVTPVAHKK